MKESEIEHLKVLVLFHGLLFYFLEKKRMKNRGYQTNFYSGEQNLPPAPTDFEVIST